MTHAAMWYRVSIERQWPVGARVRVLGFFGLLALLACGDGNSSPPGDSFPAPPIGNSLPGPRPSAEPRSFVAFESGPVRPLAISADGARLFVTNTPDNRLEIYAIDQAGLTHEHSVPVGMEPVAVAEAGDGRVWVVNHLSDSVSIVDVAAEPPRVTRTLWLGDEPRDIVFAGVARSRAFITTAHRGQNSRVDPALTTAGIGRADVWVFDSSSPGQAAGGEPLTIVTLFGDRPRPLAVSPDGSRVYAGIFTSGNQTTVLAPSGLPKAAPHESADGVRQPDSGLIVRFNGSNWVDERNQSWDSSIPFSLPDYDVFEIDALASPPVEVARHAGVGTTLFNMAINPVDGTVYVSNTNARNHVRFAGRDDRATTTVRGHMADHRITLIANGRVQPRELNKHIDFTRELGTEEERETSLSTPLGMAVSGDGATLYVAAFGSGKIGVFDTAALADDSFEPRREDHIELSAGGASSIVLDEARGRGYVATRFDNGISIVDLARAEEVAHLEMYNPEPPSITEGRAFLYDARLTTSNGNDSCATCHLFGNTDGLAWDLGDPGGAIAPIPNTFIPISPPAAPARFHPMKGPMMTQSMRGLTGHGPMHWRGDRTGADREPDETLEEAAFKEFNEAFESLMGRSDELTDAEMQAFTDFAMQITYPPNPIRNLDNSLTADQEAGEQLYNTGVVRIQTGLREVCVGCHPIDPIAGLYGTAGLMANNSQLGESNVKIPHFRDQYQKVGMFGWGFQSPPASGPQIRGFGYNHNGATSSNYVLADLGTPADELRQLRAFLFAFPTETAPVVGQQVTLTSESGADAVARLGLLVARALVTEPIPECDLIAKGVVDGRARGWLMASDRMFISDRADEPAIDLAGLEALALAPGQELTFTCVPWGSGQRMAIDRDEDGVLDGDE